MSTALMLVGLLALPFVADYVARQLAYGEDRAREREEAARRE